MLMYRYSQALTFIEEDVHGAAGPKHRAIDSEGRSRRHGAEIVNVAEMDSGVTHPLHPAGKTSHSHSENLDQRANSGRVA